MTAAYIPTSITARVTQEQKVAVWAALAQPRSGFDEIASAAGVSVTIAMEVVAMGRAAGRIEINDSDRQNIQISRRAAP